MSKILSIIEAIYVDDYRLELNFNDGKSVIVDFGPFLKSSSQPEIRKYLDRQSFRSFQIVEGDLDWNDFDLTFPISDLYENSILKNEPLSQAN